MMLTANNIKKRKLLSLSISALLFFIIFELIGGPADESFDSLEETVVYDVGPVNMFADYERNDYRHGRWRELSEQEIGNLSVLAKILYLDSRIPAVNQNKNYKILVWRYGATIENRHIKHFSDRVFDPFEHCTVKNCRITYKDEDFETSDMVVIHLHRTKGVNDLPPRDGRNPNQIWTFLTDESPHHTFLHSNVKLRDFNGIFNWSMTYSMKSDIPVPYGRTVPLPKPNKNNIISIRKWKMKKKSDVLVAILGSNCGSHNHRWEYVRKLKEHIKVDVYGACGSLKCPGHFTQDCEAIGDYMFYLAFENSNCDEYITEKLWWNAYSKDSIPIVMGAKTSSLSKLLPPFSYINVDDFGSPSNLADYVIYLNKTESELQNYFQWKKYFTVLQEHGYFKSNSVHYCRMCEGLNYNHKNEKVYEDLEDFWSTKNCYPRWDVPGE